VSKEKQKKPGAGSLLFVYFKGTRIDGRKNESGSIKGGMGKKRWREEKSGIKDNLRVVFKRIVSTGAEEGTNDRGGTQAGHEKRVV